MYDLLVVGGGVNGTAIARDAAGRGLQVLLVEKDDLASHTSSASTKLIHGGLRYLENYEFRMVRHSLKEREVMLKSAPHIIWPLRFVLPHHEGLRPQWLIRLGLFLYDHLGERKILPKTARVNLTTRPYAGFLKPQFQIGFEYSDCWVDDARLVVLNAVDARERGAEVLTRTECVGFSRSELHWTVTLKPANGLARSVSTRTIVNAAGAWVEPLENLMVPSTNRSRMKLVKGSHIVVHKLYEGDHAYIMQHADGRVVFAIPYERDFTLIGTTDVPVAHTDTKPVASEEEVAYLCALTSDYFAQPITPDDVVWTYAGVRPLFNDNEADASKITRDYRLEENADAAPLISVYGGKVTTSRILAEDVCQRLAAYHAHLEPSWTADAVLPGGNIMGVDFDAFFHSLQQHYQAIPSPLLRRLARAYGTNVHDLLGDADTIEDLGQHFGADLYEKEVRYLIEKEFAFETEDILWRRSKLGLFMKIDETSALNRFIEAHLGAR